jgi:hypothetical protein
MLQQNINIKCLRFVYNCSARDPLAMRCVANAADFPSPPPRDISLYVEFCLRNAEWILIECVIFRSPMVIQAFNRLVNTPEQTTAAEFPRYSKWRGISGQRLPPMARAFCAAHSVPERCRSISRAPPNDVQTRPTALCINPVCKTRTTTNGNSYT